MHDTKRFRITLDVTLDDEEYRASFGDPEAPGRTERAMRDVEDKIRGMIHRDGLADGDISDSWKITSEVVAPDPATDWVVIHCPNGGELSDPDDLEASSLSFEVAVDREQAQADAEYTHGDDFGTVLAVIRSNDPEAAFQAYIESLEDEVENLPSP